MTKKKIVVKIRTTSNLGSLGVAMLQAAKQA
jgi:hypothetical protein